MNTWIKDDNGNKCSVEWFGSKEAAQAALDSLKNCRDCTNCSRCSRCSDCSDCSGCSHVAWLDNKKNLKGDPDANPATLGQPPIPKIDNIHSAVLEAASKPGALNMGTWHTCGTTHCRAGWVVHLAGEAGYALERFHNTALAAQLIYRESGAPINPGRFYETDDEAMADMQAAALKTAEGDR